LWLRQSLEAAFFTMGSFKLEMRERDSLAPHRQPDPVQGQRRQDPSTVHALSRQDDVLDQHRADLPDLPFRADAEWERELAGPPRHDASLCREVPAFHQRAGDVDDHDSLKPQPGG
jgi:hypothetical protein